MSAIHRKGMMMLSLPLVSNQCQMLWHSLNFPLHENQQRRMCAKHSLEEHFVKLLVAQQSSAPHNLSLHDTQSQTNTNRSGRPQRLPPGYYQNINPMHLRTIISTSSCRSTATERVSTKFERTALLCNVYKIIRQWSQTQAH